MNHIDRIIADPPLEWSGYKIKVKLVHELARAPN